MNRRLLTLPAPVLLAVLAVGCKPEEKAVAAKDYPQKMARGYCEAVYSCSCEGYPYDDFNECFAELSLAYDEVNDEAFLAGLVYDGTCPARTLDEVASYACASSVPELPANLCVPPCNTWHGPLPVGSSCEIVESSPEIGVSFSTCAQGLSCISGVCVDPCQLVQDLPGLGEPCPNLVCDTGAVCELATQVCVMVPALPGPGEACQSGLCDPDVAICVADTNVCALLPSVGEPCLQSLCGGQSYCGPEEVCLARPPYVCGLLGGGVPGDGDGDPTGDGDGDGDSTGDGDGDPSGPPNITGTFLFALDMSVGPDLPLQFVTTVVMEFTGDGGAVADFTFQPLSLDNGATTAPREFVGEPLEYNDIVIDSEGNYGLDMGAVMVTAAANPITGSDMVATLQLLGGIVDADNMCGELNGNVSSPLEFDLAGSTYGATRLADDGSNPATLPTSFPYACDQIGN